MAEKGGVTALTLTTFINLEFKTNQGLVQLRHSCLIVCFVLLMEQGLLVYFFFFSVRLALRVSVTGPSDLLDPELLISTLQNVC